MTYFSRCVLGTLMLAWLWLAGSAALAADSFDRHDLYSRLENASDLPFQSIRISGTEHQVSTERRQPPEDPEPMVGEFEQKLRKDIKSGQVSIGSRERELMKKEFGTSDLQKILTIPKARAMIEKHIQSEVSRYRFSLTSPRTKYESLTSNVWTVVNSRAGRRERTYEKYLIDDVPQPSYVGQTDVEVANATSTMLYAKRLNYGRILDGLTANPDRMAQIVDDPNIVAAGRPSVRNVWAEKDIASTENVLTPEGEALKVAFSSEAGNPFAEICTVIWVLPGKGYALQQMELHEKGLLGSIVEYGQFHEVSPGVWYPSRQKAIQYHDAPMSPELRKALADGTLKAGDPGVCEMQRADVYRLTERDIQKVEPDLVVDDAVLKMSFPTNTMVQDMRVMENGQPLTYRLGHENPTAFKNPDADREAVERVVQTPPVPTTAVSHEGLVSSVAKGAGSGRVWWLLAAVAVLGGGVAVLLLRKAKASQE